MSNNSYLSKRNLNTLNSSTNYKRRSFIRKRLQFHSRSENLVENNSPQNSNDNNSHTNTSFSEIYNPHTFIASSTNLSSIDIYSEPQSQIINSHTISMNNNPQIPNHRRNLNKDRFIIIKPIIVK